MSTKWVLLCSCTATINAINLHFSCGCVCGACVRTCVRVCVCVCVMCGVAVNDLKLSQHPDKFVLER